MPPAGLPNQGLIKKHNAKQYHTSSVIGGGPIMEDKGSLTVQNPSGRQPLGGRIFWGRLFYVFFFCFFFSEIREFVIFPCKCFFLLLGKRKKFYALIRAQNHTGVSEHVTSKLW